MCLQPDLVHSLDHSLGVEHHLLLVLYARFEILQGLDIAIVGSDESSEDESIVKISIEVGSHFWMHLVDLGVVVGHPLQQNHLRHAVNVALRHVWLDAGLCRGHTRQVLEALWSHTIQIIDLENLVEHG